MTPAEAPPLSLYVHIPWCVRKCPYCDFNSHTARGELPEAAYVDQLIRDLDAECARWPLRDRVLQSIFIGGGTPSLFSPAAYVRLLDAVRARFPLSPTCEITLEANPGTVDEAHFSGYVAAGINRLSLGVQTFHEPALQALGRIHTGAAAVRAVRAAQAAGLTRLNIDLMHGLPAQTPALALADLQQAIDLGVDHLSWYQLTLEPNTVFYRQPPELPDEDVLADIQDAGQAVLRAAGLMPYEVSAYARPGQQARHNLNYWTFGDYLGIGAGAHGKITTREATGWTVWRTRKTRRPEDYLATVDPALSLPPEPVAAAELPFEFMLNALRLVEGVPASLWTARTGRDPAPLLGPLRALQAQGLCATDPTHWVATPLGFRFLNRVIDRFLPEEEMP